MSNNDKDLSPEPLDAEREEAEALARMLDGEPASDNLPPELAQTASFLRAHRADEDGASLEANAERLSEIRERVWARGAKRSWKRPRVGLLLGGLAAAAAATLFLTFVPTEPTEPAIVSVPVAQTPAAPAQLLSTQQKALADTGLDLEDVRAVTRGYRYKMLRHFSNVYRRHALRGDGASMRRMAAR